MARVHVPSALLLLALAACAGDDPDPLGPGETLTEDQLDELRATGDLFEAGEISPEAETQRREAAEADADAVIDELIGDEAALVDQLLWEVESPNVTPTPDGNQRYVLPSGQEVLLYGVGLHRRSLAAALQRTTDLPTQERMLETLLDVVPDHCRGFGDVSGRTSAHQVAEAVQDVARCWDDWRTLVEPFGGDQGRSRAQRGQAGAFGTAVPGECDNLVDVGAGDDGADTCVPSSSLGQSLVGAWTWDAHLPPTRNQVVRGSCVAFATASALEYSVSRLDGVSVDVSEQQLYSLGKFDLYQEHFGDGLPISGFFADLDQANLSIALEDSWGYNPSWCREDTTEYGGAYVDSCLGYSDACSETSHQLGLYTGTDGKQYFWRPALTDQALQITESVPLHYWFLPGLEMTNAFVDAGWGVVAGLAVDEDFMAIGASGRLSQADDSHVGYHAVHVVRWVPDATVAGGGWVVIKNSWGCGWGDAGYAYLTARWFHDHMTDLNAVRPRRDVLNTPPTLSITSPSQNVVQSQAPLGNTFTLTAAVSDAEDGAGCCDVSWWSSVEGYLGEGLTKEVTFSSPGVRVIRAITRDSYGSLTEATRLVTLTNEGPEVAIVRPTVPVRRGPSRVGERVPVGEPIAFSGTADDPNQLSVACGDRWWIVDDEAVTRSSYGCTHTETFDLGWHQVVHRAKDDGDVEGQAVRWLRAVEWTETDRPFVQITVPASHDGFLDDAQETLNLTATAVSGHPDGLTSVRWVLIRGTSTEIELGEGAELSWTPSDDVGFSCGGESIELRVEATDANGTSTDTVDAYVYYPVC